MEAKKRPSGYFSWQKQRTNSALLDSIIARLNDVKVLKGEYGPLTETELYDLSHQVREVLLEDPVCLDIDLSSSSIYVIGDIFGQFRDLIHLFHILGHPEKKRYLFLGNYGDLGRRSIETISLLFAYKVKYPRQIYLLRGNHECEYVSCHYGLLSDCVSRYTRRLWRSLMNTFDCLPACAIIEDSIFCVHGGLDPSLQMSSISDKIQFRDHIIDSIRRPVTLTNNPLFTNLVWSEPIADISGWETNPVGLGYWYGQDVIKQFCERFQFSQIIRAGDMTKNGYEFMADAKLLSIFTAPHLSGAFKNFGAVALLTKSKKHEKIHGRVLIVKPNALLRNKKTAKATITVEDSESTVKSAMKDKLLRETLSDVQSLEDRKFLRRNKRAARLASWASGEY